MKISSAVILAAAAIAIAAPASAKTSIIKAQQICKTAVETQTPPPKSFRVNKKSARATDTHIWLDVRVRNDAGEAIDLTCTVDREAGSAALGPKV